MVLIVEPHHVPSLKGSFHRKVKEAGTKAVSVDVSDAALQAHGIVNVAIH
jgi:hypothetical protein